MSHFDFDLLHNVSRGKHFYQFFKEQSDYLQNVLPFLKSGLKKEEACLWTIPKLFPVEEMVACAEKKIIGFSHAKFSGQMTVLSAQEWYWENGKFSAAQASRKYLEFYQQKMTEGYQVLRIAGSLWTTTDVDWLKVISYEEAVHKFIKENSIIALCLYPILECNLSNTHQVLNSHDEALVGSIGYI